MKEAGYAAAVEKIEQSEQREYFFGYRKAGPPEAVKPHSSKTAGKLSDKRSRT